MTKLSYCNLLVEAESYSCLWPSKSSESWIKILINDTKYVHLIPSAMICDDTIFVRNTDFVDFNIFLQFAKSK